MNQSKPPLTRRCALTVILAFGTAILLLLGCFALRFTAQLRELRKDFESLAAAPASASEGVSLYTLREYDGKIGIFAAGDAEPIRVLDVYVFTLPEADRLALRTGIRVYSSEALRSLIEDFTG